MINQYKVANVQVSYYNDNEKVAALSAIFGNKEKTAKFTIDQSIDVDFILYTDRDNLESDGKWDIRVVNYHLDRKYRLPEDVGNFTNSVENNKHPYNIYKFYKQQFYRFPDMDKYDYVVWIDSTLLITNRHFVYDLLYRIKKKNDVVAAFDHQYRSGRYENEVARCRCDKRWRKQPNQPFQNLTKQKQFYKSQGFHGNYFKKLKISPMRERLGLWTTGIMMWNMRHNITKDFLDLWYLQTLNFTTQCQVSFPYCCWKFNIVPTYLPGNVYSNGLVKFVGHYK